MAPTITNPRRILLVGAPNSGKLTFLKELTGSLPPTTQSQLSYAGLSHTLSLKTNYYEVDVPIWVDEWIEEGPTAAPLSLPVSTSTSITESTSSTTGIITTTTILTTTEAMSDPCGPTPWSKNYHAAESKPVLSVLGGFILCFRKPPLGMLTSSTSIPETLIEAVRAVGSIIRACGSSWDGVALAVGMPSDGVIVGSPTGIGGIEGVGVRSGGGEEEEEDVLSDLCQQWGFEYVDYEKKGRNDYGERQGVERVKEALEANDWDDSGNDGNLDYYDDDGDEGAADADERGVLGSVAGEFEQEMFGLRQAIERGGSSGGGLDGLFDGLGEDEDEDEDDGEENEDEDERKQVEDMERVMMKMAMLRDLGGEDEEQVKRERRKLAQELLREIMMEGEVLEGGSRGR